MLAPKQSARKVHEAIAAAGQGWTEIHFATTAVDLSQLGSPTADRAARVRSQAHPPRWEGVDQHLPDKARPTSAETRRARQGNPEAGGVVKPGGGCSKWQGT